LSITASSRVICKVALYLVPALLNSPPLLAKIACWLLPHPLWLRCAMPPENQRNFIAAKEIFESALQSPKDFLVYVIRSRLAHL
jgi:hypothetical protein